MMGKMEESRSGAVAAPVLSPAFSLLRDRARNSWLQLPWPEAKDPDWRYGPPSLFESERYAADDAADLSSELSQPSLRAEEDDESYSAVFRFVDGLPSSCCLDEVGPVGLFSSLGEDYFAEAASGIFDEDGGQDKLRSRALAEAAPFLTLAVSSGIELDKPILIDWIESRSGVFSAPALAFVLREGAKASVVLRWRSTGPSDGSNPDFFLSPILAFKLEAGAKLDIFELAELSAQSRYLDYPKASLGRESSLVWARGFFGGKVVRSRLSVLLEGEGSKVELREASATGAGQRADFGAAIHHRGKHAYSRIFMDGVADDNGASFAKGLIAIEKTAAGADAYLSSRHLSLSPTASVLGMPELAIDTDDLSASHGATVGTIDEDELFYLQSRGLSPADAKALAASGLLARFAESSPSTLKGRVELLADTLGKAAIHA